MSGTLHVSLPEACARAVDVLVASGTREDNASAVARALVLAEADGLPGHGLIRLSTYAAQVRCGKVDGIAAPLVERTRSGALRIDAANGFAYPALDLAVDQLAELAPEHGIAFAGVHRSGHCGAMGLVVERLARRGLIGVMVANTPSAMAPWGGRRPLFGTNPIACAFPYEPDPVVIDLSLSKVARGQILAAKQRGAAIPEGWALDAEGQPTTDPEAALRGTMIPAGDAKGAALALMVEALSAGATGACYAADASSFLDAKGAPPGTGQMLIAISPGAGGGSTSYLAILFAALAAEPGVRLPGARRFAARRKAEVEGLVVPSAWFDHQAHDG
jgi:(2R)-3-sulfolactate dehydrogenase (NADP+)